MTSFVNSNGERGISGQEKLLLVDDSPDVLRQPAWSFPDYNVLTAADEASAIEQIRKHSPRVISLNLDLPPDPDGATVALRILDQALTIAPRTKVIVASGSENQDDAVQAVARGAWDVFRKPINGDALGLIVKRAFHASQLEADDLRLKSLGGQALPGVITADPAMLDVCRRIERVAPTLVNALILGENGTGKAQLARALHLKSTRAEHPFVTVNCATIPSALLESELFGYAKGGYTGATRQVKGKIEAAHRGTLFLDEIGNLPLNLQAKLLRFLEEGQIERLGGRSGIKVDVRIVAANHQPLVKHVNADQFRQDLLYRLAGITIEVPSLSDRGWDIVLLAQHFIDTFTAENGRPGKQLAESAKRMLLAHRWPGNVRELANVVQRAAILAEGKMIKAGDVSFGARHKGIADLSGSSIRPPQGELISLRDARDQAERKAVDAAVKKSEGNLTTAAKLLGISRPTLYALLRRHEELQPPGSSNA